MRRPIKRRISPLVDQKRRIIVKILVHLRIVLYKLKQCL